MGGSGIRRGGGYGKVWEGDGRKGGRRRKGGREEGEAVCTWMGRWCDDIPTEIDMLGDMSRRSSRRRGVELLPTRDSYRPFKTRRNRCTWARMLGWEGGCVVDSIHLIRPDPGLPDLRSTLGLCRCDGYRWYMQCGSFHGSLHAEGDEGTEARKNQAHPPPC